jgi:MoaA/NifB/PqqE/SkfB family radical SAM enzyme
MVDLAIGDRCNSSCIMCTTVRPEDKDIKTYFLPLNEIESSLDSMSGPDYVAITGGEPTIHPELSSIVKEIRTRFPDTELKLLTNGRMLSYPDFTDRLVTGIDTLIIPLHAHHPDLHDFISRSKGSFEQTVKGIRNALRHDIKVEIRIVIHGINYPFLPETAEFIKKEFPAASVVMLYFDIIGSGFLNRERLVVPMTKVIPYLQKALDTLGDAATAYHFPPCLLPETYRMHIHGVSVVERRIMFTKGCDKCSAKSDCCGIWKTYSRLQGTEEFKPI